MKRALAFLVVAGVAVAALYLAQRRAQSPTVSTNAIVDVAADVQRDITRVPMRMTRMSDAQEIEVGNELASKYVSESGNLSLLEVALQRYVTQVGGRVALHARRKLPFQFHIIPSHDLINAFALPGGHVFVGEGLLDIMMSEDELASVLAHEIEHVDHYHCAERVQIEAQSRKLHLGVLGELAQLPIALWQAGYSKDQELEADREGMMLAVSASYSPYGSVKLFERFSRMEQEYVIHARTPEQELSHLAVQGLTGYFRSHPPTSERLAQANQIIASQNWQDRKPLKPFRVAYDAKPAAQ
jgi:beta-barrel assembly-enhancing protease